MILLSNFGLAVDYALMALAPSLAWLFVGRVLAGITSASFSTASAYIADTAPPERRAQAFGMLGALFSVGFILGPALGGDGAARAPSAHWVSCARARCCSAWRGRAAEQSRSRREPARLRLLRHGPLRVRRGAGRADARGCRHRRRARGSHRPPLGERRALLLGLASGTLGFGLQGWAPQALWFWASIPLVNLWSLYGPAMQGLMVPRVGASEQGQLQGALQGLRGLCALATPLLYTQVFARGSAFVAGAPYWLAAGLVGAALLLALRAAAPLPAPKLPEVR